MELIRKAKDPSFWRTVRESEDYAPLRQLVEDKWENEYKDYVITPLKYSEFKLFFTTGDRAIYQKPYFQRRHAIAFATIYHLIHPEDDTIIEKLMDWIYTILDEYTWCLPAHQGKLEPNNPSRIDLFASETGFILSEIDYLLGDELEPLIRNRIKGECKRRIIDPFFGVENYGWWENGHMNWTSVCMCSVAATAMHLFPEIMTEENIERCNRAMEGFLQGFGDDGFCLEGVGYWGYGFGFFVMYADMIRDFTEGRVNFFNREKVKTIATFPQKMFISGNCSVSFADGPRSLKYQTGTLHYLKKEFPEDVLVYSPKYAAYGEGKFTTLLRAFLWYEPEYAKNYADETTELECYGQDACWYVRRTAAYGFAAKAGNNNEFHNHNDVGSFIFAVDGHQTLMDVGAGKYTRQYFARDTRYDIIECSSLGHSVPVIGEKGQLFGAEYCAKDVSCKDGVFTMDIAGAYGIEELRSLKRTFVLHDDFVTLTDTYDYIGSEELTERFVSLDPFVITEEGSFSVSGAVVTFDPSLAELVSYVRENDFGRRIYTVDLALKPGVRSITVEIRHE